MCAALHEIIGVGEPLEEFYRLYEQLPPDQKDLATRWTDFYQQTLLYRSVHRDLRLVVNALACYMLLCPLYRGISGRGCKVMCAYHLIGIPPPENYVYLKLNLLFCFVGPHQASCSKW